ncbi:DNA-packaging protein [Brevundimonas sp.]|jgi:phage terminase large subunit-like protein|uniref:DNA-packaging protein n=1 Tax=Brevundimonas sp. TaxID=1871086 RepID=UPI002E13F544|nr:terminase family protein [Brevundimonas sp.]
MRKPSRQQFEPEGDWSTWVLLGGRGSGKTFAGAHWLMRQAEMGGRTLALIGPTLHDVREVMVEGPSGVKAMWRGEEPPHWEASRRRLVFPGGSVAYAFSAEDPDSLRGPQFHAAWADELCAWRRPDEVLANLRMGLRLGDRPRLTVTTTPRPIAALRRLLAEPALVKTTSPTSANAANLSPGFLDHLRSLYGGTRLEAQELEGIVVESDGALFRLEDLRAARGARPARLDRVVVAVDPPATAHGDACGVVAVGRRDDKAYVLEDATVRGRSPAGWARHVAAVAARHKAATVVAEANQGGEMVRTLLAQAGCGATIRTVWARSAKRLRAEPVAALYEQGRVVHCGAFPALEEEMMALGEGGASPDRADALVWAITDLLLDRKTPRPRVRVV